MYDVEWEEAALDELSHIWLNCGSDLRPYVLEATNQIDSMLAHNPNGYGESRDEGRRILIEDPLVVYYRVHDSKRVVRISRVLRPNHGP